MFKRLTVVSNIRKFNQDESIHATLKKGVKH